jgi:small subunit ribosomal protein S2
MRPFIFTERSGIHIIDLHQTMMRMNEYYEMVRDLIADGGTILFVGTKRQAQGTLRQEAERCGMPHITNRWLGGTLTNWVTIKQRIDYLNKLERRIAGGEFRSLTKKEQLELDREVEKLNRRIGGVKTLERRPEVLFVVDTRREDLAVNEANKLGIPVMALVDTNCDPDPIDYVIPGNDDAIRSVKLITHIIANAVEEGRRFREVREAEEVETGRVSDADLAEMEQYLGPSTLAKLQGIDHDRDNRDEPVVDVTAGEKEAQKAANAAINYDLPAQPDPEVTEAVADERPVAEDSEETAEAQAVVEEE